MDFTQLLLLFFLGVLGGTLSGLLGVGGGVIFVPVFDYIYRKLGIHGEELVRYILANSFLAILFSGLSSTYLQRKRGFFFPGILLQIAVPAMLSGAFMSRLITGFNWYGSAIFKVCFIVALLFTLWRAFLKRRKDELDLKPERPGTYIFIGVITGLVSALSGLGGGVAMIPLLQLMAGRDIKTASAISISVIPFMVIPFLLVYGLSTPEISGLSGAMRVGYLDFMAVLPILLGIIPGSRFGVGLAHKLQEKYLLSIFALLLGLLIIKYLIELIGELN
ncbi:MAG: sulfite exporter TauE/SafE family protein [Flavobacteriales bacterium]|nr:sulfite exporter TauE/SafE family protein [Flavobacteriales bacterium]